LRQRAERDFPCTCPYLRLQLAVVHRLRCCPKSALEIFRQEITESEKLLREVRFGN
jgi:hypothetical protein